MESLQRLHQMPQGNGFFTFTEGDTNGFFDVLCAFAAGMGYTVEADAELDRLAGEITYNKSLIRLNKVLTDDLTRVSVLAHEIAHDYTADVFGRKWQTKRVEAQTEQATEAVAAAILSEYGFDTHATARDYIDSVPIKFGYYGKSLVNYFRRGELDSTIKKCYRSFSDDLRTFLNDGEDTWNSSSDLKFA